MPRAKKPPSEPVPEPADAATTEPAPEVDDSQPRPSQLDQIREAIARPPREEEPELPAPEEVPELPAAETEETPELPPAEESEEAPEPAEAPAAEPSPFPIAAQPAVAPWVPPPTSPPPPSARAATRSVGPSSSLAVGIVLVVVGVFFLLMRLLEIDLSTYGWPLYVIIPGLTLLVVGFVSLGSGALIPGGIVTMTGLVLAYQSATEDWASWSYAWALVAPGGVGLGIFLQGLRVRNPNLTKQGRSLMFWAAMIFLVGFVFFESILNISGHDYGKLGQAALPGLLIIIGVTLLVRNFQRGRSA